MLLLLVVVVVVAVGAVVAEGAYSLPKIRLFLLKLLIGSIVLMLYNEATVDVDVAVAVVAAVLVLREDVEETD